MGTKSLRLHQAAAFRAVSSARRQSRSARQSTSQSGIPRCSSQVCGRQLSSIACAICRSQYPIALKRFHSGFSLEMGLMKLPGLTGEIRVASMARSLSEAFWRPFREEPKPGGQRPRARRRQCPQAFAPERCYVSAKFSRIPPVAAQCGGGQKR